MKKFIACLTVLFLASCSPDDKVPDNVLPINKMKVIIWDMSLADNMSSEKYGNNRDSQRIMVTGLYQKIFSLHKINKATFYNSYGYYEAHPTDLQVLFDSVNAYGTRQKAKSFQKRM